nr:hypothetical protein [Tanacetum cinerariifolium]
HNMVAILEKGEFNTDFHPMVDFIAASPIRVKAQAHQLPTTSIPPVTQTDITPIRQYSRRVRIAQSFALPTVVDEPASPIRDVSEGEACPTESGFIADQDRATIAKSSTLAYDSAPRAQEVEILRLKERVQVLEDRESVAAKQSGDDAPSKGKSINEGEAAAERTSDDSEELARVLTSIDAATVLAGGIDVSTGSGSIPTAGPPAADISTISEVIPPVTQTGTTPIIQYTRRARIAQSSALPTVADEPASLVRDDSQGEAFPTDSGFIGDQDRATIAKSFTLPRDSAPRVTSPAAEEGSMQQTIYELTAFCTSLQRQHSELLAKFQAQEVEIIRLEERVKVLEEKDGVIGDKSGDDAPIKGRSNNEGEAPAERISNDSEDITRVLTSMDAATVLAGEVNVPTGSGFIPTDGPPATIVSTGSEKKKKLQEQIDAQVARELEEQQEREDIRMNEQIARDIEVARIHAEEEIQ